MKNLITLSLCVASIGGISQLSATSIITSNIDQELQIRSTQEQFLTPLQKDAQEFVERWDELKAFSDLSINDSITNFVDHIVDQDQLKDFPYNSRYRTQATIDRSHDLANVVDHKYLKSLSNDFNSLLDRSSPNAFAGYILGHLIASTFNTVNQNDELFQNYDFKKLLEKSSQKYYLRATNLLRENIIWRSVDVTKEILNQRFNLIINPKAAFVSFAKDNPIKGDMTWTKIEDLENIFYFLSPNSIQSNQYISVYNELSQSLKASLILRKKKEIAWRTAEFVALNLLGTTTLSVTLGLNNIIQGYDDNKALPKAIGFSQIASACISSAATTVAYPYISNWIYKPKNGQLLPISYGDEEISLQSHFLAMFAIVLNKDAILLSSNSSHLKRYHHKLMQFVLQNYSKESIALSFPIIHQPEKALALIQEGTN